MTRLAQAAEGITAGMTLEEAARVLREWQDPPRMQAVTAVLREYGCQRWARDRAAVIVTMLTAEPDVPASEVHEVICRVNGGPPGQRNLIPPDVARQCLDAWRLGPEG